MSSLRWPGEWEPHERTLIAWPARASLWGELLGAAEHDYAEIARVVARFEPVTVLARPHDAERAAERCGPTVEVVEIRLDDSWVRDTGPVYVERDGRRVAVDFTFNGWGAKYAPYDDDAALVARWCGHSGDERLDVDLVLEGGAITGDGAGTVVTTEQCLLHPNRNPTLTRRRIEELLGASLGTAEVVWVPYGLVDDHDTDGHVDNVAAFVRAGLVLVQGCDDRNEPDHDRLAVNHRCLRGHLDALGHPLEVVEVPVLPFVEIGGRRRPVPYLNLYQCNGAVIVPVAGHQRDAEVLALLGEVFAGREVVPVPGAVLAHGGGGPHCITQQVPAAPPAAAAPA